MKKLFLWALFMVMLVPGCESLNKSQMGAAGGATGGALIGQAIGRNTEATLIGAAVGGLLGYIVGNEMDKYDKDQMSRAYDASPSYQTTSWVNPDSGNHYSVTPRPAYTTNNRVCREAEILTEIDGKAEKAVATACRDEAGRWVIQQ